jgi:hypothetical protein
MSVYIANFGRGNWAWPDCLKRQSIAVMDDVRVHPYWKQGDREGYIRQAQTYLRLASGERVIKPVASRWFNLNTVLMETAGDLWIHREKDELWWTESTASPPTEEIIDDPNPRSRPAKIHLYHKKCLAWSDRDRVGRPLSWNGLHVRAKEFLFTEGTFQQLSDDNADYAQALIDGGDLSRWHDRPEWKAKAQRSGRFPVTYYDAQRKTFVRMAMTAMETAKQSGMASTSIKKEKKIEFRDQYELEKYIAELFELQEGLCALTGLPMLLDGVDGDTELLCSLDRIDSDDHYARGNLQIVCKFVNRWKGASDNTEFVRLLEKVRSGDPSSPSSAG